MATCTVDASDRRIARVGRGLDLGALALGVAILLLAPGARVTRQASSLLVAVATLGQLTRNVILTARVEPGHRNKPFWS
jgi:hypothetical protein